jgi:hypothetical protein
MPNVHSIKKCPVCGLETRRAGKHCSQKCAKLLTRDKKIKLWLEGNHDGMRGKTSTAYWIKIHLIEQRGEKCEKCGWREKNIHTGKIPIELSHKDGDFKNNKIANLELICPNCHALTDSYKGANKKSGRPRSKYYRGM